MPEISTALIIKIIVIVVAIGGGIAVIYSVKKSGIERHWQTTEPCQRPAKDHK
ncbi:MAG: hypothetical protein ACLR1S_09590 [Ruminococcus bicirculans (ex Wegman et al. 2014)]